MEKTRVRPSDVIGFAANNKRNGVRVIHSSRTFVEA